MLNRDLALMLTPLMRLAKVFESPVKPEDAGDQDAARRFTELTAIHKNYLDYRAKTEFVSSTSRLELDKNLLAVSGQGILITIAVANLSRLVISLPIQLAWVCWALAIVTTFLGMFLAEQSADLYLAILDEAYDLAKVGTSSELPVQDVLAKRSKFTRWFIGKNKLIMFWVNLIPQSFFIAAIVLAIWWSISGGPLKMTDENHVEKQKLEKQDEIREYGIKLPTLPRPAPKPADTETQQKKK